MLEELILWRRLDLPGHDACELLTLVNGWQLCGTAIFHDNGQPCHLRYAVECDHAWHTRSATVSGWLGRTAVQLAIHVAADGEWLFNGIVQTAVAGLVDIDLGFTPATNLIQLRRLNLMIGQEVEAPTAYLHFPELTLGRLEHRYKRLALDKYEYSAPRFDYAAILQVSEQGFVTQYPGLWAVESLA